MPNVSFTIFRDKVVSGEKRQTIRERKTDYWLQFSKSDPVYGWWKLMSGKGERLFESEFSEDPFVVRWKDFDDKLMIRDGFESLEEANRVWFIPECGKNGKVIPDKEFVVLRWKKPRR